MKLELKRKKKIFFEEKLWFHCREMKNLQESNQRGDMTMMRMISILLARIFLSLVFIGASLQKFFYWTHSERNLIGALCDWQDYAGYPQSLQECMTSLVPWSSFLLIIAALLELFGGLMILFSYREKTGALLLMLVLIPATIIFHSFWFLEGEIREIQTAMFFKNLAIFGGLILISIHGAKTRDDQDSMHL